MNVRIPVADSHLIGRLLVHDAVSQGTPALMFIHGWGSSQRRDLGMAKGLVDLGYGCLTFNLTGHARTRRQRATVTRAQNLRDVLAAYDVLRSQPWIDPARIGFVGASYGAYLAVLATAERKVRWLALQAPALYKDADFDKPKRELNLDPDLARYRRAPLGPEDNRALRAAERFEGHVVLVESEHDDIVPHQAVANYLDAFRHAASVTHHVLTGADHGVSDVRCRRRHARMLRTWFRAQLTSSGARHAPAEAHAGGGRVRASQKQAAPIAQKSTAIRNASR
jgi:dipeptidyl aminopeptidase/acylaminoacyl peptidase